MKASSRKPPRVATPESRTLTTSYGAQFERAAIWMLLRDKTFAQLFGSHLRENDFERDIHAEIMSVYEQLHAANPGAVPSCMMVASELRNAYFRVSPKAPKKKVLARAYKLAKQLSAEDNVLSQADREHTAKVTRTFILRGRLRAGLVKAAELYEKQEYEQAANVVREAYERTTNETDDDRGIDFLDARQKIKAYRIKRKGAMSCPMNIPNLDKYMCGGLEAKTLGMFIGPPGRGKSRALIQAGIAALTRGRCVVHVTLELSQEEVALRYDAHATGVPINDIKKLSPFVRKKLRRRTRIITKSGGALRIKEWPTADASMLDIATYCKWVSDTIGRRIDLILIDSADLMRGIGKDNNERWAMFGNIVKDIRKYAVREKVAIWTTGQTTKSSFNSKLLSLEDVSDTVEKARVCDVIIGLCQTPREKIGNRMRMIILKNRLGGHEGKIVDVIVNDSTQTTRQDPAQTQARHVAEDDY